MSMANKLQYGAFGALLARLRQEAGFAQQSDFAKRLEISQQTVSRWELGASRPRDKQMPQIASVLGASLEALLAAAGYTPNAKMAVVPTVSFDQPFPIDALAPDSFERFCFYFLARLYPAENVHRAGAQGHTQDGLDVDVQRTDGTYHTFQCKRAQEFGPAKVQAAVAAHTREAAKKFILLTRVASPQARQVIRTLPDWSIWDKEDIARIIRQKLSRHEQGQLVDTFFPGQRLALLGETDAGPWQTAESFFAPFMSRQSVFSHDWDIVGRGEDVQAVVASLENRSILVSLLVGSGGAGKSRILRQAVDIFQAAHTDVLVRFLSPNEDATGTSLANLGVNPKVLIVDDAHDRTDLAILFQYVANPQNQASLLLALRPYGLDHIKDQASRFNLVGERIFEHKFAPLNLEQATQLATQVLQEFNGPIAAAHDIARLTLDCTLATVIGAQIVAKENIHIEFAKNDEAVFRRTLLGRFKDVIAGGVGEERDAESIEKLLKIFALIQPFYSDDDTVAPLALQVEALKEADTKRLIPLLANAGVLFKRGGQYRIAPDLLADFIVEKACVGENGASTGYAESVFDAANGKQMEHLLLNLGKLDWRRANGDPSNSRLLDGVWSKLKPSSGYSDPYISAVKSVAYYQPARTLVFAEKLIRDGSYRRDLPEMIKYAAYNFEHLRQACECLWELGKQDERPLNQNPEHAIRILAELCAVEPEKPGSYNEEVVDFVLSLFQQEDAWIGTYSPLDVLEGILLTEGYTSTSDSRSIHMSPFLVNADFVADLREKVVSAAIGLLSHGNVKVALKAAKFLENGLRYPMGLFGQTIPSEVHAAWTAIFVKTLESIENATLKNQLDALVFIELCNTVSWHANFADEATTPIAKRIMDAIPGSLEFRTIFALVNGNGRIMDEKDYENAERIWDGKLGSLVDELVATYKDGEELCAIINAHLTHIGSNHVEQNGGMLYYRLIDKSTPLAIATIKHALSEPNTKTTRFAGIALAKILAEDHLRGLHFARQFLQTNNRELCVAVGCAYADFRNEKLEYTEDDLVLLRTILSSKDELVVVNAIAVIRLLAAQNQSLAIALLKEVDFNTSVNIAENVMRLFHGSGIFQFNDLTEENVRFFIERLKLLNDLGGYWVATFVAQASKHQPLIVAKFLMDRVEHAVNIEGWGFHPCNLKTHGRARLLFSESKESGLVFLQFVHWAKEKMDGNYRFRHYAAELFNAMFSVFDNEILGALQNWIDESTPGDMVLLSQILRGVKPGFVFEHKEFVLRFLERAKQHGNKVLESGISALCGAAIGGLRSGTLGEPYPRDVQMKEDAIKAQLGMSRFSPAYPLYKQIEEHAEQNIQRALKERETFED